MDIINLEILIKAMLIAWMWVNFEPFQNIIKKYVKPYLYFNYLKSAISCLKCVSFWVTLTWSMDPFTAIAAAVVAYVFEKVMGSFKTYL